MGEVRYGGRSYELEHPEASAPAVRSTTITVTGPGVLDYDVTVHWSVPRPEGIMPVATNGRIVLLAPPGNTYPQPGGVQLLRALDTRDGHTLWSHPLEGFGTDAEAYVDYPPPTLLDGYVYAITTPTKLSALDALTGRTVYSAEVGTGVIRARPDRVAVLSSGRQSAVGKNGRVEWIRNVDAKASGLALDDNRVYVTVNGRHPSLLFCPPS